MPQGSRCSPGRRSIVAMGTRNPETPAPAVVGGSELVTVNRWQARAWEQAIAAVYHPEPAPEVRGWNAAGEHGAPVGYDLLVAHQFDSAGQPWLHTHVIVGALTRPERPGWTGPQRQREVWVPLNEVTVAGMAERLIFGYQLLLRQTLSPMLRELGLNWQQMAQDGSCEVWGMTAAMLECISEPARRLGEIHACQVE